MMESKQAGTCNFLSIARSVLFSQMYFCILLQGYTIVLGTKIAGRKNTTMCCFVYRLLITHMSCIKLTPLHFTLDHRACSEDLVRRKM